MTLKDTIKKSIGNPHILVGERRAAARFVFVVMTLVFFLNYFFVGSGFYREIFIETLVYSYVLFLLSFLFFVYYYMKDRLLDRLPGGVFYVLFIILLLLVAAATLPFVMSLDELQGFIGI